MCRTAEVVQALLAILVVVIVVCIAARCLTGTTSPRPCRFTNANGGQNVGNLRETMRKLWTDHVVWTRLYIISALENLTDKHAALGRLLKNQEDIGNAIGSVYGAEAGSRAIALLKEHIVVAGHIVDAAKVHDTDTLQRANTAWYQNAAEIAKFLADANPHWQEEALRAMMEQHLQLTTKEVNLRLAGNWAEDVKNYDAVYIQALGMADALSDGILKQRS